MYILMIIAIVLTIKVSASKTVVDLKKKLRLLFASARSRIKMLQKLSETRTPSCVISTRTDTDTMYTSSSNLQKIALNILLLDDISTYTTNNSLLTPHLQRKVTRDNHRGKNIAKLIERIYGPVKEDAHYSLKEASCGEKGAKVVHKMLVNVYRRLKILIRLLVDIN